MTRPLRLFLILVALIGAAAIWLATHLDLLIENAITENGSAMTKATVSVDTVKIAASSGKGTIGVLLVANPPGFRTAHAFKANAIEIDIDLVSLASDVVIIRLITINGPDVNYEHGATMSNFDAIQNAIGAHLAASRNGEGGQKLIVEELTIYNATAQASAPFMGGKTLSIPLSDFTLKNIGKARGGISPSELGQEVTSFLQAKLIRAASINRLRQSAGVAIAAASVPVENPPR